ncbi:hypothetical protein [Rufibacter sp. LB8]|uniref:hypothetical protein n=1 Tax=Rufibacter sp. LB8 TaxID=2777781 RepID=UPI00178C339A|nr:hypothetical protein [Rufibacter sp. LB8]
MNTVVKKKVAGMPIETLLKNSHEIPVDNAAVNQCFAKLQALRQTYMVSPLKGSNVFVLPRLKK